MTKSSKSTPFDCRGTKLLRQWMRRRGYTATDLSRDLRCSPQFAKKILEGKTDPRARHLFRIRDLMNIPIDAFRVDDHRKAA